MSKSPITLTALAAVAVNLAVTLTAFHGFAQEPEALRRQPVRILPLQAEPVKPSRPQQFQVKRETRPGGPATIAGPGSQLADLVVVPYYDNPDHLPEGFPTHSYCMKKPTGGTPDHIRFYIRNVGNSASTGFQWTPSFPNAGAAPAHVLPSVPAGGQVLITQPIPAGCYDGNYSAACQFSIHLDDHNEVTESSEANTYASYCVSPAG